MCERGLEPEQQGYCGLCQILYQDLNQHLSSPQHQDAVSRSGPWNQDAVGRSGPWNQDAVGRSTTGAKHSSQSAHNLLERFLHDVLKHHPNRYGKSSSDLGEPQKYAHPLQQHEATPTPQTSNPTPQITWSTWQQNRRWQQRGDFSSEHSSSTIEQVIRHYCYSQDDDNTDSVHFSLPLSIETQTDWDIEIQEGPAQADIALVETLLELQVDVDPDYSQQLEWALETPEDRRGYLEQPIETVLPLPQRIPPSFRGKSWADVEKEDEARVLKLVQQFKTGVRTCYFDSESLARYGWRGYKDQTKPDLLPLFQHDVEMEPRKRLDFGRAARCQVVKLNRATQTLHVSSPTVAMSPKAQPSKEPMCESPAPQAALPGPPAPEQLSLSGVLSEKYTSVLCPLQRQTSMLYLLCSPHGHTSHGSDPSPSPRRRRRPTPHLGSKVTYRRLPLTPFTVKPFSVKSFPVKARCVRQLFRNLSPELNTGPAPKVTPATTPRREGLRSCRPLT